MTTETTQIREYECGTCRGKGEVKAFDNLFVPPPSQEEADNSPTLKRIMNEPIKVRDEKCPECKGLGVIYA